MSNRFYVNDKQIFGNNEMFKNTYAELERQGAEWTEDGTFSAIEIKEPQGLMDAVEKENKELKQQIKKIGDFIRAGDLCSICKFENKCNPNECFNQNIRVYTKWELAE